MYMPMVDDGCADVARYVGLTPPKLSGDIGNGYRYLGWMIAGRWTPWEQSREKNVKVCLLFMLISLLR